jgi:hypothetical protein
MLADAGYLAIPVVILPDGTVLVEPSNETLADVSRTLAQDRTDVRSGSQR